MPMTKWMEQLVPDDYVSSVYDIDLDKLWQAGKRLILTDLDNTLVPWNDPHPPESLVTWLKQVKAYGFHVCIVSNNEGGRVDDFANRMGCYAVSAAKKPKPVALIRAMEHFGCVPEQTVMVGDQIFTDIRAAKRAGVRSFLVVPISPKEWWPTQVVRTMERLVLWKLVRSGRIQSPTRQADWKGVHHNER